MAAKKKPRARVRAKCRVQASFKPDPVEKALRDLLYQGELATAADALMPWLTVTFARWRAGDANILTITSLLDQFAETAQALEAGPGGPTIIDLSRKLVSIQAGTKKNPLVVQPGVWLVCHTCDQELRANAQGKLPAHTTVVAQRERDGGVVRTKDITKRCSANEGSTRIIDLRSIRALEQAAYQKRRASFKDAVLQDRARARKKAANK